MVIIFFYTLIFFICFLLLTLKLKNIILYTFTLGLVGGFLVSLASFAIIPLAISYDNLWRVLFFITLTVTVICTFDNKISLKNIVCKINYFTAIITLLLLASIHKLSSTFLFITPLTLSIVSAIMIYVASFLILPSYKNINKNFISIVGSIMGILLSIALITFSKVFL